MKDFTAITELPDRRLNTEQLARITQRYGLGAKLAQDKDVLEVACGAGVGLGVLHKNARSLVGCDYTGQVLAVAQQHYGQRVPLVCADAQQLPFADHTFDLVLSFEAIYYLNRLDWFFGEAQRLLRQEGTLLLCTSNPNWPHFVAGQMSVHYPTLPELAARLTAAGFLQQQFWGALPHPVTAKPHQTLVARLRKYALQNQVFAMDSVLTRGLKQIAYGPLLPLPPELSFVHPSTAAVDTNVTPLAAAHPDQTHRVLFAVARRA